MPSPAKKRSISDFFKPYNKSTVPAKRPSPSSDEAPQRNSSVRNVSPSRTPKTIRRRDVEHGRTPTAAVFSPLSTPGSRSSLPIRSPRPKSSLSPASIYKQAPRFDLNGKHEPSPQRSAHSFNFADLPASTQSVVKDGKVVAVRDSDEDTDSLLSLDDILGRRKDEQTTSCSSSPEVDEDKLEAERVKTLSLFTRGRSDPLVGKDKLRALYAKQNAHKFDIGKLLNDHFDDEETEEKIKKAQDNYDESTKPRASDENWELDQELLATVATAEDGEDGVARLLDAVQRQEALATDRTFSFFGVAGPQDWTDEAPAMFDFPEIGIPKLFSPTWDSEARCRAYLSGYMAEFAARGQLATEALTWTFHQVVLESRDGLRDTYIDCLFKGSATWTRTNLTAQDVQSVFQILGAEAASLQDSVTIAPRHRHVKEPARKHPKYLLAALDLFRLICQDMDFAALSKLVSVICRLAIDQELMSDGRISYKVEEMLEVMLSLPDYDTRTHAVERIVGDIGHHLKSPFLQAQLLSHILPTSTTASQLRILLARTFLLGNNITKPPPNQSRIVYLDVLTKHINTLSSFDTSRHKRSDPLDYVSLRHLSYILDVAIGDGGRPAASFGSRAEAVSFNKSVDRLADAVRATFISIVDTGASHMSRTEAKDVLQALHWRLLYSVRTEVRPKKNIFDAETGKSRDGDEVRSEQKRRDFLKNFLDAKHEQAPTERHESKFIPPPITDTAETGVLGQDKTANHEASTVSSGTSTALSDSSDRSETEQAIRRQLGLS